MRRFKGFFSVRELSGDLSSDCGCGRVLDSTVVVSLSEIMMVAPMPNR